MPIYNQSFLALQSASYNNSWENDDSNNDRQYMLIRDNPTTIHINEKTKKDNELLDIMKKYYEELEHRKQDLLLKKDIIKELDDPDDESINDIDFLQNIIKIKNKIYNMTNQYKLLQNVINDNETLNDTLERGNKIQSIINKITRYRTIIKDLENKEYIFESICTICQCDTITHCIIPCGHTYCNKCTERVVSNKTCYICRKQIKDNIKLYIL